MKKIIGTLAIYASLAIVAVASFANVSELKAQTPAAAPAAAQGACTDDAKAAWYAEFTANRTTNAKAAYEAGKKYLTACPTETGPIPDYLKKWTAQYDKDARRLKLADLFVNQKKYPEAMALAKEILAEDPENLSALTYLGYGGYVVAVTTKNEAGNAEAVVYAKKAIQAIQSGKTPENWLPFKSKDDALGYLNYSLAYLERTSNPTDALANAIKAAQFDSEIKKNSQTYVLIAQLYEGEYAKQSAEYEKNFKGKDESPESKLAVLNINQIVDRIIDALARAAATAGTDANSQAQKAKWLERAKELYVFRNKSETGLDQLVATVMSKPLPPVPTPITTLPAAPATSATPATGSDTSAAGSTMAPRAAAPPAASKPMTTTTVASPAVTTTTKTTAVATPTPKAPVKAKTRNNHRRH
jgi:hypothetical protein